MTMRVGLTGGIGSGKTTVCKLFARMGVPVIDADVIARQLVSPGQPALQAIIHEFGEGFLDTQGQLRRFQLRDIVFRDPAKRQRLEDILHPLILQEMENQAGAAESPYCILAIPLLVETGQHWVVDRILVIDCPEELQIRRVMDRDHLTVEEVRVMMQAQTSRGARLKIANDVIVNDGDIIKLEEEVIRLHQNYLALSSKRLGNHASRRTRS